jgi:RNA polymerase sigma-70 factor (ECF subfamily)
MSVELDDADVMALLARVAQRDETAFRRVYEGFARRVYAFALHRIGDPAACEELVADTLHEVWKRPGAYRGESRFSTWLLGIARHKIIDRLRARGPVTEDIDEQLDLHDPQAPDDFHQVAQQQLRDGVARCLARLGEPHRECLHLVFYEDMSVADVAAVQAVPEGTVKTRLFHARAKLKQCLQALRGAGHG